VTYDPILIKKCLKRDRKAQNELYKQCYTALISVCWRYANTEDQAVEYLNTGFIKILFNLKKYKNKVPFELWARKVMINSIIDDYRKQKRYREHYKPTEEAEFARLEVAEFKLSDDQEDMLRLIKNKVKLLPPVTSKVFNLYAIDGYKHHEIASLLKISEGTSHWHYSIAKKRIREMIGESQNNTKINERAS
jgi:RNA polymerase sigma-70 factor (ECF subfamily)